MNFLPSFAAASFAIAGLIAAAGPVIIHLLNRRRYRTVHWAAMDFLREALRRNRRILTLRDILLLTLRTLVVLLVGLALARPFFSSTEQAFDGSKPLHAVLLVDNSLSMAYELPEGTRLDQAKERARRFVDRLPEGSRVTVVPLCGSLGGVTLDASTKAGAMRALAEIETLDRSASVLPALHEARRVCELGPRLSPRVVIFSDQQASNWRDLTQVDQFADLAPIQVVDVSAVDPQNIWIAAFRVQDGVADVETPTTFLAEIRYDGVASRRDVEVALSVADQQVATKIVTLEPGRGAREVAFEYLFNAFQPEPGKSLAVPVKVSLTPDNLPADDERHLIVHVVAALPVVFVDQYGADEEDPLKNRLGETRLLRKLLAPVDSRSDVGRQLIRVRHVRVDQLSQELLEDARLVVIAGIADPGDKTSLLREYVEQGGQLFIAAGGQYDPARNSGFDPARWTASAWLDGAGILPAPLLPDALGAAPDEARGVPRPFFLSFASLQAHRYFQLADVGEQELRDLYAEPLFFKAVRADVDPATLDALRASEQERLETAQRLADEAAGRREQVVQAGGEVALRDSVRAQLRDDEQRADEQSRNWLLWSAQRGDFADEARLAESPLNRPSSDDPAAHARRIEALAERSLPRVLARFDDPAGTPFLVTREIGRGNVLFASSGLLSNWNTLSLSNAVVIFDRALRSMIQATLPPRNFETDERIVLPLPARDRDISLRLRRPNADGRNEVLDTGFVGRDQLGFEIERPFERGLYRVTAFGADPDVGAGDGTGGADDPPAGGAARATNVSASVASEAPPATWELALAVNGDPDESELQPLSRDQFDARSGDGVIRWLGPDEQISLAGNQLSGQDSWWWLILAVLGLLSVELLLVGSRPAKTTGQIPSVLAAQIEYPTGG